MLSNARAIHADADAGLLEPAGKSQAGELTPLIGVEDIGLAVGQRLLEGVETEAGIKGIGQLPTEYVAAVPVDDSHQVHESLAQRAIGDIGAPDLVGRRDRVFCQQVGVDRMAGR